jgi:hypothetical protein
VRCFNDDAHSLGAQGVVDGVGDLRGHPLLELKALGECLDDSSQLADTNDTACLSYATSGYSHGLIDVGDMSAHKAGTQVAGISVYRRAVRFACGARRLVAEPFQGS